MVYQLFTSALISSCVISSLVHFTGVSFIIRHSVTFLLQFSKTHDHFLGKKISTLCTTHKSTHFVSETKKITETIPYTRGLQMRRLASTGRGRECARDERSHVLSTPRPPQHCLVSRGQAEVAVGRCRHGLSLALSLRHSEDRPRAAAGRPGTHQCHNRRPYISCLTI